MIHSNITSFTELNTILQSYLKYNFYRHIPEQCFNFVAEMNLGTKDALNDSWRAGKEGGDWSDDADTVIGKLDIERTAMHPRRGTTKVVHQIDLVFVPNHELEFGQVLIRTRPHSHHKALSPEVVHNYVQGIFN